jgi:hypothetical protein
LQAAPYCAHTCADPHVPLVAPGGTLQTVPEQQSASAVHAAPAGWHAAEQVPVVAPVGMVQMPEQHWPPAEQARPFETQETHLGPVPTSRHSSLQHAASPAQGRPAAVQLEVCVLHLHAPLPGADSTQVLGAQQERSSGPAQAPSFGVHVGPVGRVQWRTPLASGTQGAPPQHWSLNWQTFAVVTFAGSTAGMQQAGSFASYPAGHREQSSFGHPPKHR